MPESTVIEQAIEPCQVCGSIEFNLSCPHCREILLTSGQMFTECVAYGEPPARGTQHEA